MTKFKYGDRVKTIKDNDNNGFFVGLEGVLQDYRIEIDRYGVFIEGTGGKFLWCTEGELEKI